MFLPGEAQGRGAWWAAVYGVAQSRTRLKRLSSSSSKKGLVSLEKGNQNRITLGGKASPALLLLLLSRFSRVRLCATP